MEKFIIFNKYNIFNNTINTLYLLAPKSKFVSGLLAKDVSQTYVPCNMLLGGAFNKTSFSKITKPTTLLISQYILFVIRII